MLVKSVLDDRVDAFNIRQMNVRQAKSIINKARSDAMAALEELQQKNKRYVSELQKRLP